MPTRDEHIAWCKTRALEYFDRGDLNGAVMSMLSDLRKHPETENHPGGTLGAMLLIGGHLARPDEVKNWIEGFR